MDKIPLSPYEKPNVRRSFFHIGMYCEFHSNYGRNIALNAYNYVAT